MNVTVAIKRSLYLTIFQGTVKEMKTPEHT